MLYLLHYLGRAVAGSFVVGELQFAEGDFLSHPVGPCVWGLWVDVDFVP